MNTDKEPLLYANTTYKIRAATFKVYNNLGFGHKESVYHKALAIELTKLKIKFEEEKSLPVKYDNQIVGHYKPDFVAEGKIIIEIKALPILIYAAETQMLNYLKGTSFKIGLLINFGGPKLIIIRKIWSMEFKPLEKSV